ncbi:MAG: GreA/GreB family elongation factor [Elusimicrobiota bacterium]|nr:GreA/GreB family elongation factor [Elusimicrobiota bacterium]
MSRAFTKEDGPELPEDPSERPVSPHPNYVTPRGAALLQALEERLVGELAGYEGTQDDPARRRRKRELERDLRYCRARRDAAILVDPSGQPKDEVRFGARATLRKDDGTERVLRVVGEDEAEEGGELVPWPAPFVQALFGLKAGQSLEWEGEAGPEKWTVLSVEQPS